MDFHDPVAAGTHLGYAAWCLISFAILMRLTRGHPPGHRFAVAVYATSAFLLYLCSGLFHSLRYDSEDDPQFEFFRRLDLSAIFGLIAGSCVPICVYLLPKWWRRASLGLELGSAATGIILVWSMQEVVAQTLLFVYIAMGLVALVPLRIYVRTVHLRGIALVLIFASIYVVSALVQAARWPNPFPDPPFRFGYHEIFHLGNMLATFLHSVLLVKFVLPHAKLAGMHPNPNRFERMLLRN